MHSMCFFAFKRVFAFFFFLVDQLLQIWSYLVIMKFTTKQLEIVEMHLVWHRIYTSMTSRLSVSKSKMAAKAGNDLASAINTRGTS